MNFQLFIFCVKRFFLVFVCNALLGLYRWTKHISRLFKLVALALFKRRYCNKFKCVLGLQKAVQNGLQETK